MLLQIKNLYKSYATTDVLIDIDIQINEQERVGLIGPNGAGKSTLLKIITGEILPDRGEVLLGKKVRIGYLAQDTGLQSNQTIWDELLMVFSEVREIEQKMRELENEMGKESVYNHQATYEKILSQYATLQEEYEKKGGYTHESKIRGALHGLGLGHLPWKETRIENLSGGQKTRVALAKMILEEPDLLILDEPTNYLDLDAIQWLEQTLSQYKGALLIVSHDRYFLDRLVSIIYELENHQIHRYVGNYSDYVVLKEERLQQELKAFEQQQAKIKKMEDFIQRNIARASTTKRAQSRRKALEKMDRLEKPKLFRRKALIRFDPKTTSGKMVLTAEKLSIGYDKPLISDLSFRIERGEHIAILGPNGIGKSTLLKTIIGQLPLLSGQITWGTQVEPDYYDQEQKGLDFEKQVLEEIWDDFPHMDQSTVRTVLGQFLFSGEDVYKKVGDLSGGEKARLSLCKRLLNQANFLLMDEPTNHLDLESKERLEEALEDFPGTLLFVSHDRYFIQRIATRIWEVTSTGIKDYPGNYEWYLQKKALEQYQMEQTQVNQKQVRTSSDENRRREQEEQRRQKKRQQQLEQLEQEIAEIEQHIATIHEQLCQPEVFNDLNQATKLQQELQKMEELLEQKTDQWAELAED